MNVEEGALSVGAHGDDDLAPLPHPSPEHVRGLGARAVLAFGEDVEHNREEEDEDDGDGGGAAERGGERVEPPALTGMGEGHELVGEAGAHVEG